MRFIVFAFIFNISFADESFQIDEIRLNCYGENICKVFEKDSKNLKRSYESRDELESFLRPMYSRRGINSFSYDLENSQTIVLKIHEKKVIDRIKITGGTKKLRGKLNGLILRDEKEYYSDDNINKYRQRLINQLVNLGYLNSLVGSRFIKISDYKVGLYLDIKLDPNINYMKKVKYNCSREDVLKIVKSGIGPFKDKRYVSSKVEAVIQELQDTVKNLGYYFADISLVQGKDSVFRVSCGDLSEVHLKVKSEIEFFDKSKIFYEFREMLKNNFSEYSLLGIDNWFNTYMQSKGYDKNTYSVDSKEVDEKSLNKTYLVTLNILKDEKNVITKVNFIGNSLFSDQDLEKEFFSKAIGVVNYRFFDKSYLDEFNEVLRSKYIESGFLSPKIAHKFNEKDNQVRINFSIREGIRTKIRSIKIFDENNKSFFKEFLNISQIKVDDFYNPRKLERGLKAFFKKNRKEGYVSSFLRSEEGEVAKFTLRNREVDINIDFFKGKRLTIDRLYVSGLVKTKNFILQRRLKKLKGRFLTGDIKKSISNEISNLNLFKKFQINQIEKEGGKVDLQIVLSEKDFGLLEVSPGYRSDIGAKLSLAFLRKNMFGRNITGNAFAQINMRPNLSGFNSFRKAQNKKFPEYSLKTSFNYPDFFKTYWDSYTSASLARRRLFFVDADILRFNQSFKKDILKNFSFSLGYQYENIRQFNSAPRSDGSGNDDGKFEIGSILPALVLDLRDNPILPRKGGQFQLNFERALPLLGSQNNSVLRINYSKVTSRNRLYLKMGENFYFATSLTFGFQFNYSRNLKFDSSGAPVFDANGVQETNGFIPSIKVYRLSGIENVRGYAEDEVNVLSSGLDISDGLVRDKAFMTNIKFEPRYRLTESIILGLFYDAGNVQINTFDPLELRSSVGLSLKYVTPVGTLDLDYGHKIQRRTGESAGRFHLSIGFF